MARAVSETDSVLLVGEETRFQLDSTPDAEPEVLIVGAGPVGLFAGLLLAQRGIRVEIVDQERRPAARSYALALHAATLRLLNEAGIAAGLLERAQRVDTLAFYEGGERRVALDLSTLSSDFPCVAVLPQQLLENALESRLVEAGGRVLWNHRVSEIALGGGAAAVHIDRIERVDRSEDSPAVVTESYLVRPEHVIGADGHRSVVRKALHASWVEMSPAALFAVFEMTIDRALEPEVRVVLEPGTASVLWPLGPHRARWSFQIESWEGFEETRHKSRRFPQVMDEPFPYLVHDRLAELTAARAPWFTAAVGEILWSMVTPFEHRLASRFGQENAWLAGDAAHLASPIGAQSMNVGLREAWDLAVNLDWVLRDDYPFAVLERCVDKHRREWHRLFGAGGKPQPNPATPAWVRKNAGRLTPCIPASGDDLDRLLRQIGLELTGGEKG
jgi:2-polyprenyl-6-methoxyphenol hydroxylase-like FAD-dependent oxidoreductase